MTLIVKRTNPFDDTSERDAWARYCQFRGYDVKFGLTTAKIDAYILTPKGISAVELMCNNCWNNQLTYPPDEEVHIPARKLEYFREILEGHGAFENNVIDATNGYLIIFNTHKTRAAVVMFDTILKEKSSIFIKELHGIPCEVITIPHKILQYITIPNE